MVLKILVIVLLIVILYCLGSALIYLFRYNQQEKMVKALTWRILLSVILFLFLLIAHLFGWISPHGVVVSLPPPAHQSQ